MFWSTRPLRVLTGVAALALAACSPPLAATPTSAPAAAGAPTTAPAAAAPKPTTAPAAAAAAPTTAPAAAAAAPQPTAAAAASGGDPALDAAIAKYYDAAKKEGKLIVYGVGTATLYNPVRDAFIKRFPGIDLQGVDQRGRESREKVFAEQQSKSYTGDVVISGTDTQNELSQAGYVEEYDAAGIGDVIPDLVPSDRKNNPRTITIFTIAINTNLVPPDQEPKTMQELLDPKWKGKLEMDDPRGSGPGGTVLSGMEVLYGIDNVDSKLAEQNMFFATQAGPLLDALARGEYAVYLSSAHTDVIAQRKAGAPIKQIKPSDGVGITPINQALLLHAPHPNAGKLWIEWSLSQEGQLLLAQQGYAAVRKGLSAMEPEADMTGVKFLPRDDDPANFALLGDRTKRWNDAFFKGA
jgi:ABC-type Fe3+ transport system substrate-binding protein